MRSIALLLFALALPFAATADSCSDCRDATTAENQRCDAAATTPAAKAECQKKAGERSQACDVLVCKAAGAPRAAGMAVAAPDLCLDCRVKVSGEGQRCDTAAKTAEAKGVCMKQFQAANAACPCPDAAPKK